MAYATETYVVKGMRRDDSDLLFNGGGDSLSFAFDNLNMRFMADAHTTSLVAVQEKGNRKVRVYLTDTFFLDTVPPRMQQTETLPFRTVGVCTVDKYLVVFGKCTENIVVSQGLSFGKGNDVIVRFERYGSGSGAVAGWVLYNGNELDFRTDMPLETLGNVETDIVKKVYFVDGVHGPRAVNVVNPEGGNVANINLGYELELNDVLTVKRDHSVHGNFPMGKVRFFYTYFNDTYSETSIVDWSPFFDCSYTNQGGSPDSTRTTPYAFRVTIENTDSQFKFVRIYWQHFTSDDASVYTMRYIERPVSPGSMSVVVTYDQQDAKDADRTYLDIKATNISFIPYTMAEKDNRMFYGNIRNGLPDTGGIDFSGTAGISFSDKLIGYEQLDTAVTYKYKPDLTTFNGSNYEYMGFRKDNWYRFGIIAQYRTGEWSDVFFIGDARCTRSSRTKVVYDGRHSQINSITVQKGDTPLRSEYYIPKASLTPESSFYAELTKLKNLGFKRVKPVCVVPPYQYRDVITQGISCPTVYAGGQRRNAVLNNNGLFSMPSWFFRPSPLFSRDNEIDGWKLKASYPYTIRSTGDLKLGGNIKVTGSEGGWILNPEFTDEKLANYNTAFREWRHGFSLPPKDRINAELQSSDFSVHDYFYMKQVRNDSSASDAFSVSRLFSEDSVNLFGFSSDNGGDAEFRDRFGDHEFHIDRSRENWYYELMDRYGVLPWHDLHTTGYDSTVFVDESFCTLNSPEVDYDFSRQVEPWFTGQNIEVVGFAQVTGSMANIDIPDTQFKKEPGGMMSNDSEGAFKATGSCLHSIASKRTDWLDTETAEYIKSLAYTKWMPGNPFVQLSGPWWLDTMLVSSFIHAKGSDYPANVWALIGVFLGISGPGSVFSGSQSYSHDDDNLFGTDSFHELTDKYGNSWTFGLDTLYSIYENDDPLIHDSKAMWFVRSFDLALKKGYRRFRYTPSFYGETTKNLASANCDVTTSGKACYPYIVGSGANNKRAAVFCDFSVNGSFDIGAFNHNAENMANHVGEWSRIPMSWNTVNVTFGVKNDGYWDRWSANRTMLQSSYGGILPSGTVLLPFSSLETSVLADPKAAVHEGDFRGVFSYYFNPFGAGKQTAFYRNGTNEEGKSQWIRITHPFLLPHNARYANESVAPDGREWITSGDQSVENPSSYSDIEDISESRYYFNGSEFGCHYYAPFSTNFTGSYFDPYYAHVVYPFMTEVRVPFCGSHDIYDSEGGNDCRPSYNSTNSCLYSSCTNYVNAAHDFQDITTYSAYYHAPKLTQESRPEPSLSAIPFVDPSNSNLSRIYSFNCSDSAAGGNVPTLTHRTYTLTAAMKWYRGFKSLQSTGRQLSDETLVSTGVNLDKSAVMGNLLFSGFLPQFFTHNGLLSHNYGISGPLGNYKASMGSRKHKNDNATTYDETYWSDGLDDFVRNDSPKALTLDYLPAPHIVYHNSANAGGAYDGTLHLLPSLNANGAQHDILAQDVSGFVPQYYWKEYIDEMFDAYTTDPYYIKDAFKWMSSTYPHSGHFEDFLFDTLRRASDGQPYWNAGGRVFPKYPSSTSRRQLNVNFSSERLVTTDSDGNLRKNGDYWVLPISNVYRTELMSQYGDMNPYTYENISVEQWDWKMCGYTVRIDDILAVTGARQKTVEYLEGDTYFQRYNCFKTVSSDTVFSYLWNAEGTDSASIGKNDVTETASVMIESYVNLDGLYWEYDSVVDRDSSPLVHPFWNNMAQINPVYSIQNGLCDTFKVVDREYYNSELTHYPTMLLWSVKKHDGEVEDSFGIVPAANRMLVSGECGAVNKLLTWGDRVYCLQEHGLSILNWNAQVIQPTTTESLLSIYLSDSTKLQDVTYVSRTCGTLNKWSVAVGRGGFYWTDETQRGIYGFMSGENGAGLVSLSESYGFRSWARENIKASGCLWDADTFFDNRNAFKAHVDTESGDIYWSDGNTCLCFSEPIGCFTSFYSYGRTPWKLNWLDGVFSIYGDRKGEALWEDQCTLTHNIYGIDVDAHVELLVNPAGQYDKVFNFIEYNAEAYLPSSPESVIPMFNPFTKVSVMNMYQQGDWDIDKQNTSQRFRVWRTAIPREKNPATNKGTLNRIRGPWCRVRLEHVGTSGHPFNGSVVNEYRDKLYYINVNYTIPEQPVKSTVRG